MLFMVNEQFRNGEPGPIRDRFASQGRMMPEGVIYHASWVDPVSARCYQITEAPNLERLNMWIGRWGDLIDFEVVHFLVSQQYWAPLAEVK